MRPSVNIFNNSSKAIDAICPKFGKNVALVGGFKNSLNYGDLALGLVAMATESSHRLIMGKLLNCIFSITTGDVNHIWQL